MQCYKFKPIWNSVSLPKDLYLHEFHRLPCYFVGLMTKTPCMYNQGNVVAHFSFCRSFIIYAICSLFFNGNIFHSKLCFPQLQNGVIHLMYADGKQKEGQTNCSLVFSKKYFLLPEYSEIHFKMLYRTTAKGGLWKYVSCHYFEIAWKIVSFSDMIVQCPFCLFRTNFSLREAKYKSYIQGKQDTKPKRNESPQSQNYVHIPIANCILRKSITL